MSEGGPDDVTGSPLLQPLTSSNTFANGLDDEEDATKGCNSKRVCPSESTSIPGGGSRDRAGLHEEPEHCDCLSEHP